MILLDTTVLVYAVGGEHRGRVDARALALGFVDLLSPLVNPGESDLARGLELFEQHEALGAFDAVLAAVVLARAHLTGLMSADRAFSGIAGLTRHDPADPARS